MNQESQISKEVFTQIFKEYSEKIVLYLNRFVGREDAEDLMQEVFIKAYNSIGSFEGNSKLSTWVYKIATNAALDRLKSFSYRKEKSKVTSLEYVEPLRAKALKYDGCESDIEYSLLKAEMNQCIADYINKLPDNYRAIFLLREYEDRSIEDISEITQLSGANIKIRLHRARKKLHQLLLSGCSFYYDEYSKLCCDKKQVYPPKQNLV